MLAVCLIERIHYLPFTSQLFWSVWHSHGQLLLAADVKSVSNYLFNSTVYSSCERAWEGGGAGWLPTHPE